MSQLLGAFDTSDFGWLGGSLTATFLLCFVGWTAWAFAPGNRASHEAAARLPLDGGES